MSWTKINFNKSNAHLSECSRCDGKLKNKEVAYKKSFKAFGFDGLVFLDTEIVCEKCQRLHGLIVGGEQKKKKKKK